jgi:hypothetical protein
MKQQLEILQKNVGRLMQECLAKGEFETVTNLSPLLARVQGLQKRAADIEHETSEIESALKVIKTGSRAQIEELAPQLAITREIERARPQTLKILIDWKANKRDGGTEEICENTAAGTMAAFVSHVVQKLGLHVLAKLEQVRINRGPLVSTKPAVDFVNLAQGNLYAHKKIRGTDYYILTHSQTTQKITDLNRVCRVLGFVPGSVQIQQINRDSWLDGLLN